MGKASRLRRQRQETAENTLNEILFSLAPMGEWEDYVKAIAPPRDSYAALTLSKRVSDGKVIRDVISETKTIYLFPHAIAFDLRRVYLLFDLTYVHLFTHEVFMDTGVNEIEEYQKKVSAKNHYVT